MKLCTTGMSRSRLLLCPPLLLIGGGLAASAHAQEPTNVPGVGITLKRWVDPVIPWFWEESGLGPGDFSINLDSGGGGSEPTQTAKEQETDDRKGPCDETAGNPVVLYTGNKVEHELDFASASEMGLFLRRSYNHHWSATGLFGNHWLSNFDYSLAFSDGQNTAWNQRPDGRRIKFHLDPASGRWNEDKAQPVAYVVKNADGSFTLHNDQNGTERYNPDGYVTQLRNEQGVSWDFAYSGKYLQTVTHASGRQVKFSWSDGQVAQVTDPAGNTYQYAYTPNVFGAGRGRLASATLPGTPSTTISYHYEDARYPGGFTGKSFNGVRYSTFAYDGNKRTTLSEHAGGVERYTFSYVVESTEPVAPPPSPVRPGGLYVGEERGWCETGGNGQLCYQPQSLPGGSVPLAMAGNLTTAGAATMAAIPDSRQRPVKIKTIETNPLGRTTTYAYEDGRQTSVTGAASARCAASYKERSYDANGYPDLVHDFADNLTDFDYSPQGYVLKQVEATGTPSQRVTTFEWDTAKNRRTKVTVAGDQEASYTYDPRGNVASVTVRNLSSKGVANQSRTTNYGYTYHSNGLKASIKIDGPLAQDDVTSMFSAQGDLVSVTNALGHSTGFGGYDGLGQPARITQANGQVREYSYDARGRVTSQRDSFGSSWATTSFGYDGTGNLASITRPDGITERYQYDAARRLQSEVKPLGDGTYAWTRYSYDAASNVTRKEVAHTDYPLGSTINGRIDELTHDGNWNWFLLGWACSTGSNSSIEVHGYAEGGVFLAGAQANLASEAGVAAACHAGGSAYRFKLPITLAQRQQLGGRKITLHGISPQGSAFNQPLGNAGVFAIPAAPVIGDINFVNHDAGWNYYVEGWACSMGVNSSIEVQAYVGGPSGSGTLVVSGRADRATDGNIANACQSQGTAYWFKLPLSTALRQAHGGKAIYIHGISPVGQQSLLINRSGSFTVPAAPVIGDINFVNHDGGWNYYVEGWACSVGVNSSIDVHAYVGGPAGSGTFAASGRADLASDGNIANACQSQGRAYWFRLPLSTALREAHGGKPIYIHGISPVGQQNLLINRSGSFTVPAIVRAAEFVTFNANPEYVQGGGGSTLTAQIRNTGNVIWDGNTYLAWGLERLDQRRGLPGNVPPGGLATFTIEVEPPNPGGTGSWVYTYVAQMATGGAGWGPRPTVSVSVENVMGGCSGPSGLDCEVPR